MDIIENKCPNCGAGIKVDKDAQIVKCPYCGSEFRLDDPVPDKNTTFVKNTVPNQIVAEDVTGVVASDKNDVDLLDTRKGNRFLRYVKKKVTTAYIAKVALLSALAFVMYMYVKFKLPFMFPSFLEMQFSELPAILAGFSLGPVAGVLVVVIKCLIKFPFTSTAFVGEIMDMILGILYVLPASIIYMVKKSKKGALVALLVGTLSATLCGMLLNRFLAVPFYVTTFFGGNFDAIVSMCSSLYPGLTKDNFYNFYIFVAVLPFNVLRLGLVSLVTFFVYKRLSKLLHWEIGKKQRVTSS